MLIFDVRDNTKIRKKGDMVLVRMPYKNKRGEQNKI